MKKSFSLAFSFVLLCLLAVQGNAALPSVSLASPAAGGAGTTQAYQIAATNSSGASDVSTTWLIFTSDGSYVNTCGIRWDFPNNGIQILNDSGTAWSASVTMGSGAVLHGFGCDVPASSAYKTNVGNTEYGYAVPTFKPGFTGVKTMLGLAANLAGQYNPTPYNFGTWNTGGGGLPTTYLLTPASGSTAQASQLVQFGAHSNNGVNDLASSWFIVSPNGGYPNSCGVRFLPPSNCIQILNDAGTDWGACYPISLSSQVTLSSGQCTSKVSSSGKMTNGPNDYIYTAVLDFKQAFSGPKVMLGLSANLQGQYQSAFSLGNLTIPTMQDEIIAYVKESPATLNPGEVGMSRVTLSQAGQDLSTMALRVYNVNDPVTFRIRFGRPNQQVWVQRRAMSFVDGAWVNESLCSPTIGIGGHEQDGACLLGSTDGSGFFQWNGTILNSLIGMTTVQFYLGSQAPDPAYPTTTYGPMNENNYIGALVYFVIGVGGFPQPPVW